MKDSERMFLANALFSQEYCEYDDALENFELALKNNPKSVPALLGKAKCLLGFRHDQSKMEEGLALVNKLYKEHNQQTAEVYLLRATFLWRLGNHNEALDWIKLCESSYGSNDVDLLYTKARIYATKEIQRYEDAKEIAENLPDAKRSFILGRIKLLNEEFLDAAKSFRRCFLQDSSCKNAPALENSMICQKQHCIKKLSTERKLTEKDEKVNIMNLNHVIGLAKDFLIQHKDTVANLRIASFTTQLLALRTDFEKISGRHKKTHEEIIDFVQHQQSLQNITWSMMMYKSESYLMIKNFKEALIAVDEGIILLPKKEGLVDRRRHLVSSDLKSKILFKMEKYDDCIKIIKALIKNGAKSPKRYKAISECYERLDDIKKSKTYKKKADELLALRKELWANRKKEYEEKNQIIHDEEEGTRLEFKASFFRHEPVEEESDKPLTKEQKRAAEEKHKAREREGKEDIAKSVCAFLNSQGGSIIIGVADDKTCLGIKDDIGKLPAGTKKTFDIYHQTIRKTITGMLTEKYPHNVIWPGVFIYNSKDSLSPKEESIQLYEISVIPLPFEGDSPASVKIHSSKGSLEKIYFREGEADIEYSAADATRNWQRRTKSQLKIS